MSNSVLFVDDEQNVLKAFRRTLMPDYEVITAAGAEKGLAIFVERGPFPVVVSDLKMPEMDGIVFLEKICALNKDTVRIMLTGYADLENAIDAVNRGGIFRLLTKPCPEDVLRFTLDQALSQYQVLQAEKELLRGTLRGSVEILRNVIMLVKPEAAEQTARIAPYVKRLCSICGVERAWEVEVAADLCLLGYITLPDKTIKRLFSGKTLLTEEFKQYRKHIDIARELISNIPRLDGVANIIKYQDKLFNGMGLPEDNVKGKDIPFGSRVIKLLRDFDYQKIQTKSVSQAIFELKSNAAGYDPELLEALSKILTEEEKYKIRGIKRTELAEGMMLASDIYIEFGRKRVRALAQGQIISQAMVEKLKRLSEMCSLTENIKVRMLK